MQGEPVIHTFSRQQFRICFEIQHLFVSDASSFVFPKDIISEKYSLQILQQIHKIKEEDVSLTNKG